MFQSRRKRDHEGTIDNIMIVPNVDLRDLSVRRREGLRVVPSDVVVVVVLITLRPQIFVERKVSSSLRIANVSPRLERTIYSDTIIVYLIASANHDVERLLSMNTQNIIPERGAGPCRLVCTSRKPIARVEHDPHALRLGRDDKGAFLRGIVGVLVRTDCVSDTILPRRLSRLERHVDHEPPEGALGVRVQLLSTDRLGKARRSGVYAVVMARRPLDADSELRVDLSRRRYNKHTTVPYRAVRMFLAHAAVVQQGAAQNFEIVRRAENLWSLSDSVSVLAMSCGSAGLFLGHGTVVSESRVLMASKSVRYSGRSCASRRFVYRAAHGVWLCW